MNGTLKRWMIAMSLMVAIGCGGGDDTTPDGTDAGADATTGEGDAAGGDAAVTDTGGEDAGEDTTVEPDTEDDVSVDTTPDVVEDTTPDVVDDTAPDVVDDTTPDTDTTPDVVEDTTPDADPAECGNGRIEGDEECDDGNRDNLDRCASDCTSGACPGGVEPREYYPDADEDRFGAIDAEPVLACEAREGLSPLNTDCNDFDCDADSYCDSCVTSNLSS